MPRTPQPLHIFRKDITHLWPETLVTVALFVAFAWAAPSRWTGNEYSVFAAIVAGLLKFFLMPISWLVVISRLIQDESLVGDRQFWTSRPYHWPSLLAAKILYLVVFLYLPFLLMQAFLLKHAGLYPTTVLPALLHNLLLLTVIVVVPIAAISAVTSTFARALLTFIGAVIYIVLVGILVAYLIFRRLPPPGIEHVFVAILILLPLVAIVFQYATRRTVISRAILAATPLLVALLLFITPSQALIEHTYPMASSPKLGQIPAELGPKEPQAGKLTVNGGRVQVGIPFTAEGGEAKSSYTIDGVAAKVDASSVHWSSPYTPSLGMQINPGSPLSIVPVVLPLDIFNQVGHVPAEVHLSLAVHHYKADPPATWNATKGSFSVPGHGVCTWSNDNPDAPPTCSYPFTLPDMSYVTAELSSVCNDPSASKNTAAADLSNKGSFLDFDPVVSTPLSFEQRSRQPGESLVLCPGTPLTFIGAHDEGKSRLVVDLKNVLLDNLATHTPDRRAHPTPVPEPEQQ